MGKIIAFSNQKGGVGKTTTAINLAAYVALAGKSVLIADIDPQGNATSGFGVEKHKLKATMYDYLMGEATRTTSFCLREWKTSHNSVQRRFGGCGNRACGRAPQRIRFKKLSSSVKGNLRLHFRRLSAVARFAYAQRTDRGRRNPYTHTKRVFCPRRVKSTDKHHKNRKNAS